MSTTDHGFISLGKYSTARDSILHFMAVSDWANDSFGNVEAPTGYVWRISNTWEEVQPANTEFSSLLEEWRTDSPEVTDSPELRGELVGHFLLAEDSQGFISVTEYPTAALLLQTFDSLQNIYSEWDSQGEA